MKLSPHFDLVEFGDPEAIPEEHVDRLRELCRKVLEPIRQRFGVTMVTSGYRPGSVTDTARPSQHSMGEAADVRCSLASRDDVMAWLRDQSRVKLGQAIIYLYGNKQRIVHVSLPTSRFERHFLVSPSPGQYTRYDDWIADRVA